MHNDDPSSVIVGESVSKTYDTGRVKVDALRSVNVAVKAGEMVAVMGPSGSGKTTLLNCLSGIDDIDSGSVRIGGVDLAEMSDDAKTRYRATRMGFIFQSYNLLPVLTAQENVELPLLVSGTSANEANGKAAAALATVGLSNWAKHYPAELSGGQQQRVTIARALVNEPNIQFVVPWTKLAVIVLGAYAFSLLTTYLPSRQAGRTAPAEALRYE